MKKYIFRTLFTLTIAAMFVSCDDMSEITKLSVINFPGTMTCSNNNIVVTADNGDQTLTSFNWAAVSYGIQAQVTYSLQFDLPSDTIGTTPWSQAQEILVGDDILSTGITGNQINTLAEYFGLEAGISSTMVVRVKSYVDRNAYSNAVSIEVTPYEAPVVTPTYPSLWVPGDYQGWDPASAPTIVSVNSDNLYEGYIYIPEGGTLQYKYTAQADWTPMAYGDGGNGTLIEANYSGGNFTAPSAGYYELSANLNNMTWTATLTTWSIIGDATPGGWSTDTPMTYDASNQIWTVTCDMTTNASFKFRANNAWNIDFGIDSNGNLKYADNPLYPYDGSLSNLTVPSSGNYTITLDLHKAGNYAYKLKKN